MARTPSLEPTIRAAVQQFTTQVAAFVEAATVQRIQSAILGNLGGAVRRGPGRPPKNAGLLGGTGPLFSATPSRPRPKQLCPVPGCKNPAAPVFGMVCADHKSVAKSKIKEYRQARRLAQARKGASGGGGGGGGGSSAGGARAGKRSRGGRRSARTARAAGAAASSSSPAGRRKRRGRPSGRKTTPTPTAGSTRAARTSAPPAQANGASAPPATA
jgi:hypothetical protein